MKKTFLTLLALLSFVVCSAQLKTYSNYDANGDGKVDISDVTATVNKVLGKVKDDKTLIDEENVALWVSDLIDCLGIRRDPRLTLENKMTLVERTLKNNSKYNGHEYVDLGLPSGLKWATMNVGATTPEGIGSYFAWGATEPIKQYDWVRTPYQTQDVDISSTKVLFTKYVGSISSTYKDPSATDADALKTVLDPEDDAAHVNWGGDWRMPTKAERDELSTNCYWKWVTTYNGKSVKGFIVYKVKDSADKGKYKSDYSPVGSYSVSDPHIFLPIAGHRDVSDLYYANSGGTYWSSSINPDSPYCAYDISFYSNVAGNTVTRFYSNRYYGQSVRAVCP